MNVEWSSIYLTLKLSLYTTLILLVLGIPLAYLISSKEGKHSILLETLVSLPLVLPPTVFGFYLLLLLSHDGPLSFLWRVVNINLAFTFEGLVLASVIFSLPMMVHPLLSGFRSIPKSLIEASWILGKSKLETLLRVVLPNMKSSILVGVVLTFFHTVGEFGVVLMVGGNIPGETRTLSIVVYDLVEKLDFKSAHVYSTVLLLSSSLSLFLLYRFVRRISPW